MLIAKVTGSLVSTEKVGSMVGFKLLLVEPYRVDPKTRGSLVTTGRSMVAVDTVGAGEGEFVLITQGSSARLTPETKSLPVIMKHTGKSLTEVLAILANQGGLLALSGLSGDLRDIDEAAKAGNARAKLALDVYAANTRHYLGAYLVELGGADAIVFTGGIGENQVGFREMVCRNLETFGIAVDPEANRQAKGEAKVSAPQSRVQVWVIPTNEELVVARQAAQLLSKE